MAKDSIIRARDLAIGYGDHVLMERMDFDVAPGDVFLILGGSGTGKATLLRTLIGLQASLGGRFEIEGREAPDGPPPYGVLFQSGALFGSMTLGQNVALPLETWTDLDARTIQELVCAKLRIVGLDGYENHMPAELSGGMKKRAGIARAMALEPRLLFLDAPSAGLDPISMAELDDLILTLSASLGVTFVVVTHELASIEKIGSTCVLLDRDARTIVARGDPRELKETSDDPRVRSYFHRGAEAPAR